MRPILAFVLGLLLGAVGVSGADEEMWGPTLWEQGTELQLEADEFVGPDLFELRSSTARGTWTRRVVYRGQAIGAVHKFASRWQTPTASCDF